MLNSVKSTLFVTKVVNYDLLEISNMGVSSDGTTYIDPFFDIFLLYILLYTLLYTLSFSVTLTKIKFILKPPIFERSSSLRLRPGVYRANLPAGWNVSGAKSKNIDENWNNGKLVRAWNLVHVSRHQELSLLRVRRQHSHGFGTDVISHEIYLICHWPRYIRVYRKCTLSVGVRPLRCHGKNTFLAKKWTCSFARQPTSIFKTRYFHRPVSSIDRPFSWKSD